MKIITIESIEQLIEELNSFSDNFIFRGQSDSRWTLQSTLERVLKNKYRTDFSKFENYSLDNFRNKFHLYNKYNINPSSKLEWLAIMQHYGVPTRLLDFTKSPFVALYFAIEDSKKDHTMLSSVYAIDYRSVMEATLKFLKTIDKKFDIEYSNFNSEQDIMFEKIMDRYSHELIWVTEPQVANLRIDRQLGCFLFADTNKKSFEEIMENSAYSSIDFIKYNFSGKYWDDIYKRLSKMNINSKTIYGDLEGLSKSIKMFMKAHA